MPNTIQDRNSNRYDLPEFPKRGSLRHDGMTAASTTSPSSKRGGEYQVGHDPEEEVEPTQMVNHFFGRGRRG